ncbi:MAG: hypothetical protein AAF614_43005 [Chloroflexota bacterium]
MGAALGLYFGISFRPRTDPTIITVLGLGILAGLVMTLFQAFRNERPSFVEFLKQFGGNALKFSLFLAVLALRHPLYEFGGLIAVTAMTTIMGAIFGGWYGYQQQQQESRQ